MLYSSQVMHMDRSKTGGLIAAARKEKGLTQKDLAQRLHVSDRAVSKWERGAGFPDVGLLEPLAAALDLNVLDLLRGERTEETDVHAAVQEALDAFQEKRRQTRKYMLGEILRALVFVSVFGVILAYIFPLKRPVDQTITAGVYQDGVLTAYTDVEMQGEIEHHLPTGNKGYWGRFAISCVEWTCREGVHAGIGFRDSDGLTYSMAGISTHRLYDPCTIISPDLTEFAFTLQSPHMLHDGEPRAEGWCILATSPEMYEAYCDQMAYPPPALTSPAPERLPEFPSAWKQW